MTSRLTKWQLRLFAVLAASTVSVLAIFYVQIPQQFGIGRYDLTVQLKDAGGLYPKSLVTYRGFEVGRVTSVEVLPGGSVQAHLQVANGVALPRSSRVEVRSASAIGEQYVNFLPTNGDGGSDVYRSGDLVPFARVVLPTTTTELLNTVDGFLASVPAADLRSTVDELSKAFEGSEEDLGSFIDSGGRLIDAAIANVEPTLTLIEDSQQVLATQRSLDPAIRSYASSLDSLTGQLARSDDDLEIALRAGSPLVKALGSFSRGLVKDLPPMLDELADTAEVVKVYRDSVEHVLTVLPAVVAKFMAGVPPQERVRDVPHGNVSFKTNAPPACTTGFPERRNIRSPYDLSLAPLPIDSYCKVPADSPLVVRGARNDPCPQGDGRTGPTAAACGLVFEPEDAQRREFVRGSNGTGMADPRIARLFAPHGAFFFFDKSAAPGAGSWESQLAQMVGR